MGTPRYGTYVDPEIFDSEAFKSLSGSAIRLLMGFYRRQRKKKTRSRKQPWKTTNERELVFTFKDMQNEVGTKRPGTVNDARDRLVEVGFIDIVESFEGRAVAPNVYGISDRFLRWDPDPSVRKLNKFEEATRSPSKFHNRFCREMRKIIPATENRRGTTTENRRREGFASTENRRRGRSGQTPQNLT